MEHNDYLLKLNDAIFSRQIAGLMYQNNILKDEINKLKDEINKLKDENNKLKDENDKSKKHLNILLNIIIELFKKNISMYNDDEIPKIYDELKKIMNDVK